MEKNLALPAVPLAEVAPAPRPIPPVVQVPVEPPPSVDPDLRLVIEERGETFVYKTVDRRTGEVVQQLPREAVVRMREEGPYEAGAVISAQV